MSLVGLLTDYSTIVSRGYKVKSFNILDFPLSLTKFLISLLNKQIFEDTLGSQLVIGGAAHTVEHVHYNDGSDQELMSNQLLLLLLS